MLTLILVPLAIVAVYRAWMILATLSVSAYFGIGHLLMSRTGDPDDHFYHDTTPLLTRMQNHIYLAIDRWFSPQPTRQPMRIVTFSYESRLRSG